MCARPVASFACTQVAVSAVLHVESPASSCALIPQGVELSALTPTLAEAAHHTGREAVHVRAFAPAAWPCGAPPPPFSRSPCGGGGRCLRSPSG